MTLCGLTEFLMLHCPEVDPLLIAIFAFCDLMAGIGLGCHALLLMQKGVTQGSIIKNVSYPVDANTGEYQIPNTSQYPKTESKYRSSCVINGIKNSCQHARITNKDLPIMVYQCMQCLPIIVINGDLLCFIISHYGLLTLLVTWTGWTQ